MGRLGRTVEGGNRAGNPRATWLVPRGLRDANDLGRALRQGRLDLQSLIDGGMKSPRAEQFIPVMDASVNVLAQTIHHQDEMSGETEGPVANTWVLYERLFGDEALGRAARLAGMSDEAASAGIQDGTWDPFSDELLAQAMGEDASEFDKILANYT